jgi:enoyl-CoA hydratase/carnithine racemase
MPLTEMRDNVLTITFNRPEKLNALTPEIYAFVGDRVNEASTDPACRAVVLRGNGRAFSAGFDLSLQMRDNSHEQKLHSLHNVANRARWAIWRCRKPVIAAIHGYCMGGAFELVLPCDFTIATESCRLGEPEILFGEGPALLMVPWLVNHKVAKDILLTGRQFTAPEALRMGIVSTVVPDDGLGAAVHALTQQLLRLPPSAVAINKVGINRAYEAQGMAAHIDSWVEAAAYLSLMDDAARSEFARRVKEEGPSAGIQWRTQYYAADRDPAGQTASGKDADGN